MLHVYGSGRLTADPEMHSVTSHRTGEKQSFCTVRLASNNDYPSDKTSFLRVNAWGSKGTYLWKAGKKGSYLEFDGELTIPEYDKEKGRQYEPELQIGAKGHLRVLVLQKKQAQAEMSAQEDTVSENAWIEDLNEEDLPFYGEGGE